MRFTRTVYEVMVIYRRYWAWNGLERLGITRIWEGFRFHKLYLLILTVFMVVISI